MNVVITGVKGFVGREVASQCHKKGIGVTGIDIMESKEEGYYSIDINSSNIGDVMPEGCDALIHLAGLTRDDDCKDNAYNCFQSNVMGTLNLMEAAVKKSIKQFIFASTEWVYDNFEEQEKKDENSIIDITNHKSEYALSKLVSEANLRQKHLNGFCPVTVVRFGIIYGPRTSNWSAVESLFHTVSKKDTVSVGSSKTARCFVHVSDIAAGVIKAIGLEGFNIINLQGNELISLGKIISTSEKILNKSIHVIEKDQNLTNMRNVSNTKAKELMGWSPEIDLEKGLRSIISICS